jgi:hypothetical protein
MEDRLTLLKEIDAAIDRMDMAGIDDVLLKLPSIEQPGIGQESPTDFAARIHQLHKERSNMKWIKKPLKVVLIAAAVAVLMAGSVYAASKYMYFRFQNIYDAEDYFIVGFPESELDLVSITLKAPDENGNMVEVFNSENKGIVKTRVLQP